MSRRLSFKKPLNRDYRGRFQPYPTPPPPVVPPYKFCKHCGIAFFLTGAVERPYGYYFCSPAHVIEWRNSVKKQDFHKLSGTALSDFQVSIPYYVPSNHPFPPPEEDLGFNIALPAPTIPKISNSDPESPFLLDPDDDYDYNF